MASRRRLRSSERGSLLLARPLVAALAAVGLCAPQVLHAATVVVTSGGDPSLPSAATCSLRQAVVALNTASVAGTSCANTGAAFGTNDTVDLTGRTGTITLSGTQIDVDVAMTINGPGAAVLNVSGNDVSRIFDFNASGADLMISNLTLSRGMASGSGGCIRAIPSAYTGTTNLYLYGTIVDHCQATLVAMPTGVRDAGFGGGIAAVQALLVQSTVSNNSAEGGGGIFAEATGVIASVVTGNTVVPGACSSMASKYCLGGGGILAGAAYLLYSSVSGNTVNAATLTNGTSTYNVGLGGGMTVLGYGTAPATAQGARARISVGAAAPKYGALLVASTVSNNQIVGPGGAPAKYLGGGAFSLATAVIDSTISGNQVTASGYAAGLLAAEMFLLNSTIVANTGRGGVLALGVAGFPSSALSTAMTARPSPLTAWLRHSRSPLAPLPQPILSIESTIVADNSGAGNDLDCPSGPCTFTGETSLVRKVGSNVTLPPDTIVGQNPQLGALGDNGGVIAGATGGSGTGHLPTHLPLAGSPVINKGSNPSNLKTDERGAGFARVVGGRADIGALEGQAVVASNPVPALGIWPLAGLSLLLGALGWRRRRRAG